MTRFTSRSIPRVILCLLILIGASCCARSGGTNSADRVRIDRVVLLSTEETISKRGQHCPTRLRV